MNKVLLQHLEHVEPRFFKYILWREAYNLWISRRLPRTQARLYVEREERGQDGSHLWPTIFSTARYAERYTQALDRLGWLNPIERIIKTERFKLQYANQEQKVQRQG